VEPEFMIVGEAGTGPSAAPSIILLARLDGELKLFFFGGL